MPPRITHALALAGAVAIVLPAVAAAQPVVAPTTCGVQGLAEKAGIDTDSYVTAPGITRPAWLAGESLVVENFPGARDTSPGTLAFVLERTTFAPPGTIERTDTGKDALGTYRSTVPADNIVPGRTLVVPNVGPLCPQSVTPGTPGPTFTASKMGLQQAFLAGSFRPLKVIPKPADGQQAQAREHSVPSTVRVIERTNSSGRTIAYVDVGANLSAGDAELDFGWSRTRGYWGQAGFITTFRSTVTAALTQGADLSDSRSVSGIIAAGAFGPIPFTVRLGATVAGRLKAPGAARLTSTRTKNLPLKVRCQTRRSSGRYCFKVSGSGRDASSVSWGISYVTGGDVLLRGSITPTVSMLIADLVGPYTGATGGAEYAVDVNSQGRFVSGGGKAWITAEAGGELRFLGWVKRFGFNIWSKTWPY
jgi:hypothetical protein